MDIVFLDTETLGLHPDAPIWDFAALRRFAHGGEDKTEFRIRHDPAHWLDELAKAPHGEQFVNDYMDRYDPRDAATESDAAIMINILTRGALVIACNPVFDMPRIDRLLRKHGMEPSYHYHPFDIASVALGAIAGGFQIANTVLFGIAAPGDVSQLSPPQWKLPPPPWKSDALAAAVGVKAEDYRRHTAAGDVEWTVAQWDTIMGRPAS
jgi:hypothetical protein